MIVQILPMVTIIKKIEKLSKTEHPVRAHRFFFLNPPIKQMVENTFGVLPGLHDTVVRQQNVDAAAMTARMHPSGQVQKQPAPANTRHGRGRNVRERGQPRAAVDCNPGTGDLFAGFGRVVGRQTTLMTGPHGPLLREGGCGPFWRARRRSRRLR